MNPLITCAVCGQDKDVADMADSVQSLCDDCHLALAETRAIIAIAEEELDVPSEES